MASAGRPTRRAKLANVDYAVLASGQQIPEFSSDDEGSDDDFGASQRQQRSKRRRQGPLHKPRTGCFLCAKNTRSAFVHCDICSRWFHVACGRKFAARSVLGNTSCHECLKESEVSAKSELPRKSVDSLQDVVKLLKRAKKVLVVVGAGISVSCGIPDFRSKDGIYEMVKKMEVDLPEPECLFHIDYFREDPSLFFEMVQGVFASSPSPSLTHRFLKVLQDKGKLLRVYSQNIDGLEQEAGVTKYIPCHGSFAMSSCMRCHARVETKTILPVIKAGVIPTCSALNCRGVLKPEITFFGEILDDKVSTNVAKDRLRADLLLVLGTSLKVSPVAEIPSFVPRHIPQIVINKTPLKKKKLKTDEDEPPPFDAQLLGDCDSIVRLLCSHAKWELPSTSKDQYVRPTVTKHDDSNRICVGKCECVGVADGTLHPSAGKPQEEEESEEDQVVCDACGEALESPDKPKPPVVYRCVDCFDYDLCPGCYPDASERHFGGYHTFKKSA
ncbi:hypothetical protein Poli38472_014028 [Pythium oligandrum]|uniref:Deacetylase sirtuin-type domain-containing protein n=1 Tax=Pythium oligandrum TaxID=41045 RepID=A0A8K1CQ85_PYTOL|nr:hypothetical protein Poli38472_014028 [Pythium oligandrum]|eukprot:TMW66716.1 hypothetical protein Poli38472_014028 [Pythium oligandrum]